MKKHFITGLIILLPLALTIVVISFFFNLLTDPFLGISEAIWSYFHFFENGFWIFSADQMRQYVAKLLIAIILVLFTAALGALARWFLVRYFLRLWDFILHRIPIVRSIYKTSQDVISTIFASKANSFKQVVLVPFPSPGSYSIGLVTKEDLPPLLPNSTTSVVAIFVPTTPNPTSGFLMLFPEETLIYLDMTVEDAFKYVISCGAVPIAMKQLSKAEATARNITSNPQPQPSVTD